MAKPTLGFTTLSSQQQAWDTDVNDNFTSVSSVLEDNPIPISEYSTFAGLPTASSYDDCLGVIQNGGGSASSVKLLCISDGTVWKKIGVQAAAVADLSQTIAGPSIAEVQAISDKMDELLQALRDSGLLSD